MIGFTNNRGSIIKLNNTKGLFLFTENGVIWESLMFSIVTNITTCIFINNNNKRQDSRKGLNSNKRLEA